MSRAAIRPVAAPLLAAAALLPLPVIAQDPGSRETRDFVQAAAASDQFEFLEAISALALSTDPRVRAYAEQMIGDHAMLDQTLRAAATDSGLATPSKAIDGSQSMFLAALQSLRGAAFDQAYARHQVLAHRAALVTQQHYAAAGDAPAVRRAAGAAVPVITAHLAEAEQLQTALGGS